MKVRHILLGIFALLALSTATAYGQFSCQRQQYTCPEAGDVIATSCHIDPCSVCSNRKCCYHETIDCRIWNSSQTAVICSSVCDHPEWE